ncbi:hypothetical protein SEPCBS119000_002136 [Sporothrix epigloea]|uniref:Uncharacterized protein n=1 Tax=Sporothrix epigloea TaxID=1892477 RepID=A0ABP0DEQ1_9PEZI
MNDNSHSDPTDQRTDCEAESSTKIFESVLTIYKREEMEQFIKIIEASKLADDDLFDALEEFADWAIDDFQSVSVITLVELRVLLMRRGIYVANHRKIGCSVAQCLYDVVGASELPEWPEMAPGDFFRSKIMQSYNPDLQEKVDPSRIDPAYLLPALRGAPTVSTESICDITPTGSTTDGGSLPTQDAPFLTAFPNCSCNQGQSYATGAVNKQAQDGHCEPPPLVTQVEELILPKFQLTYREPARLDSDVYRAVRHIRDNCPREMMYKGSTDKMGLIYRTKQFLEFCSDNGLAESDLIIAMPAMWYYGVVLDHFYTIRRNVTNWRLVIQRMAERFEQETVAQDRISEWQNMTLAEITKASPKLLLSEVVQKVMCDE